MCVCVCVCVCDYENIHKKELKHVIKNRNFYLYQLLFMIKSTESERPVTNVSVLPQVAVYVCVCVARNTGAPMYFQTPENT